jgi:hypothetical protein
VAEYSRRRDRLVAVVGGLAFSQLITLYVTPVFYTYMDSLNQQLASGFARFGKNQRVLSRSQCRYRKERLRSARGRMWPQEIRARIASDGSRSGCLESFWSAAPAAQPRECRECTRIAPCGAIAPHSTSREFEWNSARSAIAGFLSGVPKENPGSLREEP